jgi:hypothetical protein
MVHWCRKKDSVAFVLFQSIFLATFVVTAARAVQCPFCVNGRVDISSLTSSPCKCVCFGLFKGPSCSYTVADNASISILVNRTAEMFSGALLMRSIALACGVDSAQLGYSYALNSSKFSATMVLITVPGYAASRLFLSIDVRDPWVEELAVVAAYPILPSSVASESTSFDFLLVNNGAVVVTLSGIGWLLACFLMSLAIAAIERRLLWNAEANLTEVHDEEPSAESTRRRQLAYKKKLASAEGASSTASTPTRGDTPLA